MSSPLAHPWIFVDTGVADAETNMAIDRVALDEAATHPDFSPRVRFFGWVTPAISYGTLLNRAEVEAWARERGRPPIVQRPTGGGVVLHAPEELSLSLLWPRGRSVLSQTPREAYAVIHEALRDGLSAYLKGKNFDLFAKPDGGCGVPERASPRFAACFSVPVCNDVMQEGRKVIGGALRLTKHAILYQGTVSLPGGVRRLELRATLETALRRLFVEN